MPWGRGEAPFWGSVLPVTDFRESKTVLSQFFNGNVSLEMVCKWQSMSNLSDVKKENIQVNISRKQLFIIIIEFCSMLSSPVLMQEVEGGLGEGGMSVPGEHRGHLQQQGTGTQKVWFQIEFSLQLL